MIRCQCPRCTKIYKVPRNRVPTGKKVAIPCPNCGALIPIVVTATETGSTAEPSKRRETGFDRQIIESVKDLPAMPQVILKAQQILADPDYTVFCPTLLSVI